MQKYDHLTPVGQAQLGINELEVFVYCQDTNPIPALPDYCPLEDGALDDCALQVQGLSGGKVQTKNNGKK